MGFQDFKDSWSASVALARMQFRCKLGASDDDLFASPLSVILDPAVSALRCFSCVDCAEGGALSARIQQCGASDDFCAVVPHPRDDGLFTVDRGCASSINAKCSSAENSANEKEDMGDDSPLTRCCSTDLCNGSGDPKSEGYRRSQEYFRNLMEGAPRSAKERRNALNGDGLSEEGGFARDDNSAHPGRGVGGSRLATVLVIVGTFAQALWLAGSLLQ